MHKILNDPEFKEFLLPIGTLDQLNRLMTKAEPNLERVSLPPSPDEKSVLRAQEAAKKMYAVGSEHHVTINHSNASVNEFFVRFNENERKFNEFGDSMRRIDLTKILEMPSVGSNCLILLPLDGNKLEVARSIVKSIDGNDIKIYLVDRGEERDTQLSHLYASTEKWIHETPPFAVTFSLHDADKVTHLNDEERDFYFRYLVHGRKLKLTVKGIKNGEACFKKILKIFLFKIIIL